MKDIIKMLYMAAFIIAPVMSYKILAFLGLTIPAGMLVAVVLMYGLVDLMNYKYGIKEAKKMLAQAFLIRLFIYLAVVPIVIWLPAAPFWQGQELFAKMFVQSIQIMLAGEISVFASQYFFDVKIFEYFKKFNWFARVIVSDAVSQALQVVAFVLIGWYGQKVPHLDIIVSGYILRMALSACKAVVFYPWAVIGSERTSK